MLLIYQILMKDLDKCRTTKEYVADFETTTNPDDCRVWCFSITEIGNESNIYVGKDIEEFFNYLKKLGSCKIYFHNLKFDGQFIIYYLETHNFHHVDTNKYMKVNTYTTLISDMSVFYSIEIKLDVRCLIKIFDSYKKLPFSVKDISNAFSIPELKGEIDYTKERPVGYELDNNEINYVSNDTIIVSKALNIQYEQKLTKMTIGGDALSSFKGMCDFRKLFPVIEITIDDFIRKSYRGGWTYLNPVFTDKDVENLEVYDVNSLYPSRMRYCVLPYDKPIKFTGNYIPDKKYPLFVIHFIATFKLKDNCLPMLQAKHSYLFSSTEYITECLDEPLDIYLTNVDYNLFIDMYEIFYIQYIDGYKFKGQLNMFDEYIDYWNKVKMENSGKEGKKPLRTIAKLMLNNLYGKMGSKTEVKQKIPYLKDDGLIGYITTLPESKEPLYTAMSCFITAFARDFIISSALKIGLDKFIYADTDSLHVLYDENNKNIIPVDNVKLGYFKLESTPQKARFLRAKTYIEIINNELDVKCAGMNNEIKANVTWDNFHYGFESNLKKHPRNVKGGVIIESIPFTITTPKGMGK